MGRGALAVALATGAALSVACGGSSPERGDPTWAGEVDLVVADLTEAYDTEDLYQTARFFSAGGTLDMSVWGLGVSTSPQEVIGSLEQLWHQQPGLAAVRAWDVFVTPDQALVSWGAYEVAGYQTWAQSYAFGPAGRTASQTFRGVEHPYEPYRTGEAELVAFIERYLAAWNGDDRASVVDVYAPDAIVRDDVAGHVWRGVDAIAEQVAAAPPIEHGHWPELFVFGDQPGAPPSEAIVVVQLVGECPMLEARRWSLDAGQIANEVRLTHVPSARRCLTDLPDGWWSTFELPPELLSNVTEILDVGGNTVELINAEPVHEEFARWLFDRYIDGELGIPQAAAIWFPPAPECLEREGFATTSDERYEGRRTAVICFGEEALADDDTPSGWDRYAVAIGLHELGHIWMLDHVDDDTRSAFTEATGLGTWNDRDTRWSVRAVEHAAFTLAWGLAGDGNEQYTIPPRPSCGDVADRYGLLTGRAATTGCDDPEALP